VFRVSRPERVSAEALAPASSAFTRSGKWARAWRAPHGELSRYFSIWPAGNLPWVGLRHMVRDRARFGSRFLDLTQACRLVDSLSAHGCRGCALAGALRAMRMGARLGDHGGGGTLIFRGEILRSAWHRC
jgi:hypothetical protein